MTKMAKQNLETFRILPIKKYFIALMLFLFSVSCNMKGQTDFNKILGKWVLQEKTFQINYPVLYFNTDSSAIFTSHGDTIYRFKFILIDEHLILKDGYNQETIWKIMELSQSQLVFKSLFENGKRQIYKREPNDINNK